MTKRLSLLFVCLLMPLFAQRKVDLRNTHYRLICQVPVIGAGTMADPFRPEFVPAPGAKSQTGIIAFTWIPSDDKKTALVQLVARDRTALAAILNDKRPEVKSFEQGRQQKANIEAEFKKLRKDFSIEKLEVRVP